MKLNPEFHALIAQDQLGEILGMAVYYIVPFTFDLKPDLVLKELYGPQLSSWAWCRKYANVSTQKNCRKQALRAYKVARLKRDMNVQGDFILTLVRSTIRNGKIGFWNCQCLKALEIIPAFYPYKET